MRVQDLTPGDRFRIPGLQYFQVGSSRAEILEVIRIGICSATIRPATRIRREFVTRHGNNIAFSAPAGSITVALTTPVEVVGDDIPDPTVCLECKDLPAEEGGLCVVCLEEHKDEKEETDG